MRLQSRHISREASMKKRWVILHGFLFVAVAVAGAREGSQNPCEYKKWLGRHGEFEEALRTADLVSHEEIGVRITNPIKVTLRIDDQDFHAVFKSLRRGMQKGYWESYQAEIAAYELDKMIGLDIVPPTVERQFKGYTGSLQMWVEDCSLYRDVQEKLLASSLWPQQISLTRMFDLLVHNDDRNMQNLMVDPRFHVILIDHSRAFITGTKMLENFRKFPVMFDRKVVERLKTLDHAQLKTRLGSLLKEDQIRAILERRDRLLEYVSEIIQQRGEDSVLFSRNSG
jgi:hypothetical protein